MTLAPSIPRRPITVEEFFQMGSAGIFRDDERIELIDGEIVEMSPIGNEHLWIVTLLVNLISRNVNSNRLVQAQNPIRLQSETALQPDIAVLSSYPQSIEDSPASPKDILLLIEVSDTSLRFDQRVKVPIYAESGIAEIWIVDVAARTVIVYRDLAHQSYRTMTTHKMDDKLTPTLIPELTLDLRQIFNPGA